MPKKLNQCASPSLAERIYNIEALTDVSEVKVKTPFGDPSDAIIVGRWRQRVHFSRATDAATASCHRGQQPANIYALKTLAWSACFRSARAARCAKIQARDIVIRINSTTNQAALRSHLLWARVGGAHFVCHPFCADFSRQVASGA